MACVDVTGISGTITADGNRRPIAVRTDGTFDLTTLPGFDVSKATGWNGGSVSGTTLRVNAGADEVSYQYDCGDGVNRTFIFETSLPISKGRLIRPMGRLSIPELIRLNYALLYQLDLNEWVWRKEAYERYLRYHR